MMNDKVDLFLRYHDDADNYANNPEMKNLTIRTMKCDCGLVISRDQNAAINILREGLRILNESFAVT